MHCKTARLLLDFARPHAPEVDGEDAADLQRHLSACPSCAALAADERRLDDVLGRAMRRLDVPPTLHHQLLNRLEAERSERDRRRFGHVVRAAAAIAALVLIVSSAVAYWRAHPRLDDPKYAGFKEDVNRRRLDTINHNYNREEAEKFYESQGVKVVLPTDLRYQYLQHHGMAYFRDKQLVPHLLFLYTQKDSDEDDRPRAEPGSCVQVYVLSGDKFDLDKLKEGTEEGYDRLKIVVEIRQTSSGRVAYVYVYSGDNLNWVRQNRS